MAWSRRAAVVLAVASLVAPATLAAQDTLDTQGTQDSTQRTQRQFGIAAGVTVPTGNYHAATRGEGFNTGWQGMALVTFQVPGWPLGVRLDGTYGTNSANDSLKAQLSMAISRPTDETTKLLGANVSLIYPAPSLARLQPYLLGGIGVYHITISATSGSSTGANSATKFAWDVGGGILYRPGGIGVFLEARYVAVAAVAGFPRTTFLPITLGLRFGGH